MNIEHHQVVSREEWLAARREHLAHEKAFTRERDKLSAERRALPWVKIDKPYRFQGLHGELSLADLFGGRSQLIIYHFMFGPGWTEGCQGCSFLSDHIEGELPGLSVFYRNEAGDIFHTYSTYARGLDILVGTYNYLDLTPKGRNEDEIMDWVRHHDKYEEAKPHSCCHS